MEEDGTKFVPRDARGRGRRRGELLRDCAGSQGKREPFK